MKTSTPIRENSAGPEMLVSNRLLGYARAAGPKSGSTDGKAGGPKDCEDTPEGRAGVLSISQERRPRCVEVKWLLELRGADTGLNPVPPEAGAALRATADLGPT